MAGKVGRVGDDVLYVGDVLWEVDVAHKFDVDVVELECIDGGECVAVKAKSDRAGRGVRGTY